MFKSVFTKGKSNASPPAVNISMSHDGGEVSAASNKILETEKSSNDDSSGIFAARPQRRMVAGFNPSHAPLPREKTL
jgi:hypothetical protein